MGAGRIFPRLALACLAAGCSFLVAAPGAVAQPKAATQIVFSGVGFGTFDATPSPFGFWIWCEDDDANNPYAGVCAGSIYVYELGVVEGVFGWVSGEGQSFTMNVASSDGSVDCTLSNVPPVTRGPTNTVTMTCSAPSGSGTSTKSVVVVTGP